MANPNTPLFPATVSDFGVYSIILRRYENTIHFRASVSKLYRKIVWVRVGNCSKQKLLEIFKKHWDAIKQELEAGAFLVEVV
jgi:predicted nuclease of predicted toxin-antitoxin system